MSERLRLAFVGCGAISEWHRIGFTSVPEIEVAAAVDVDRVRAEAVAKACGCAAFASLDDALQEGGFEAVDLMVPHHLHEELAIRALEAGKHVLLEKPMATDLEACERILAAARRAGTVFMVGENAQYWPEVRIARDLFQEGRIGEVVTARAQLYFPPLAAFYGGERPWRFEKGSAGGGVCIDTGSHYLRALRMWLGEIEEVVAAMGRPFARMEGESLVRALLRFRSGHVVSFDLLLTQATLGPQDLFRVTGTQGEVVIGLHTVLYDPEHPKGMRMRPEVPQGYLLSYAGQFRNFAGAVLRGEPLEAGPEESLGELRTAIAMERSVASRRWQKVWE